MRSNIKKTTSFIKKYIEIYGNKYDYSEFVYKNKLTKVKIICKKHGAFFLRPYDHQTKGCKLCKTYIKSDKKNLHQQKAQEIIIARGIEKYNNKYDYTTFIYTYYRKPSKFVCMNHLVIFEQSPADFLNDPSCEKCILEKNISNLEFIL